MSRGIKIYTVPTDYTTLELVTSTGNPQYRDIVVVRPATYDETVTVYQYRYNSNNILEPIYIKDQTCVFTDNTIIPNVTVSRKAHHDDYRALLNSLFILSASKYGDIYKGIHDLTSAKLKFANELSKVAIYLNSSTSAFNIDYSKEFNLNTIDQQWGILVNALKATLEDITINLPVSFLKLVDIKDVLTVSSSDNAHTTTIANNYIETEEIDAINGMISNELDVNILNATQSTNPDIVTGFNADMLDNYHASDIITMIPSLRYDPALYEMKQYDTVTAGNPTKTYVTNLTLGQRMKLTLNGVTYVSPAIIDGQDLEFCRCTCTCTCTCPCTCTAPCSPCTNTGMFC